MAEEDVDREGEAPTDHLDGMADGCGCVEVWSHTTERREG